MAKNREKRGAAAETASSDEAKIAEAKARLAKLGRNEPCSCGSGKKYKKCHLVGDEAAAAPPPTAPTAQELAAAAWRPFEQRRPRAPGRAFPPTPAPPPHPTQPPPPT